MPKLQTEPFLKKDYDKLKALEIGTEKKQAISDVMDAFNQVLMQINADIADVVEIESEKPKSGVIASAIGGTLKSAVRKATTRGFNVQSDLLNKSGVLSDVAKEKQETDANTLSKLMDDNGTKGMIETLRAEIMTKILGDQATALININTKDIATKLQSRLEGLKQAINMSYTQAGNKTIFNLAVSTTKNSVKNASEAVKNVFRRPSVQEKPLEIIPPPAAKAAILGNAAVEVATKMAEEKHAKKRIEEFGRHGYSDQPVTEEMLFTGGGESGVKAKKQPPPIPKKQPPPVPPVSSAGPDSAGARKPPPPPPPRSKPKT